ncbi:hypothetical protein HU200_040997 [Digitaria exilis]|uniref:Uncharacterized protein n=1 Tax=Digitaria exilis TaxID=1010633 RepID=A0A835B8F9_9POAL|nr:hypothetical protein HU200_040997 [Digitaria exilis]
MSRNLRRAVLAASAAAALAAAWMPSASSPGSNASLLSSSAYRAAPGHLGLARAHPSLGRDLAALLTPDAFLLDATHALAAAALCARPFPGENLRLMRRDPRGAAVVAEHLAELRPESAWDLRLRLPLAHAEDGRFDDALQARARLAAERPSDPGARLSAAGICYLVGKLEEGNRWVSEIPESVRWKNKMYLRNALLAATLGGAVAGGIEGVVGWVAFEAINIVLWAKFADGDMFFLKRRILSALLRHVFADKQYKGYYKGIVAGDPSKE